MRLYCRFARARVRISLLSGVIGLAALGSITLGCADMQLPRSLGGPGVKAHDDGERVMFSEIDLAVEKQFEPDKAAGLNRIAAQSSLDSNVQIYLVYRTFRGLAFDDDRVKVIRTLIRNPVCNDATRTRIRRSLSELTFDSSRTALELELNRQNLISP